MSPRNQGATWTPAMDEQLVNSLKQGASLREIAEDMGRSTTAIIARMEYLSATAVRFGALKKILVENL